MSDPGLQTGLSVWELMAVDPAVPMDRAALRLVIRDQRRWSRTYVYPWLRVVSRVLVTVIVGGKRACPVSVRRPRPDGPAVPVVPAPVRVRRTRYPCWSGTSSWRPTC